MASLRSDHATMHMEATPDTVWQLLADVENMGKWSPECIRVHWLHGATAPAQVGAEFRGHNKAGIGGVMRWSFRCRIVVAEPGREIAWATLRGKRQVTIWRYNMSAANSGTDVTESFEAVSWPPDVRLFEDFVMRDRNVRRHQAMLLTLKRIKTSAEQREREASRTATASAPILGDR